MSYTSIPNQPIIFQPSTALSTECGCSPGTWKQLVDFDDQVFFQLEAGDCTEKLPLSGFDNTSWSRTKGDVCSTAPVVGGNATVVFTMTEPFEVFRVVVVINSLDEGSLTMTLQGGDSYTFYTAGTYELFLSTQDAVLGDLSLFLFFASDTYVGCFSLDCYVAGIKTDIQVAWVDADTLDFIAAATYVTTVVENKVTVAIDMTINEVGAGCYRLAINDNCDVCVLDGLCNQELIADGGCWSATGDDNWQLFPSGQATIEGAAVAPGIYIFANSTPLCIGSVYEVSYALTACEGGNSFRITGLGPGAIRTAAGAYTETLTAVATTMNFRASIIGAGYIAVEQLTVKLLPSSVDYTLYSETLSVGDYDDPCQFLNIGGCNAADQFGFAFAGSSFLPSIRLEGIKYKPQYDTDVDTFRYASGRWSASYVDRRKKWSFNFGRVPERVLDFLSTVIYYDNCYINDELYFPSEGEFPTVSWENADNRFGSVEIEMYLKSEKVSKVLCAAADANCLPSILDNDLEDFLLTEGGERITTEGSVNILW